MSDGSFPYRVRSRCRQGDSAGSITVLYRWCGGKAFAEVSAGGHQLHLGPKEARELARLLIEQARQIERTLEQRRERQERAEHKAEIADVVEQLGGDA